MTKSRILKNLNLRKKADCNFRGTFLKNRFRHLKLYSNPPRWFARSRCHMGTFWKTKDWSSHFWESQPFRFWYMEVHCQRRFKSTKRVFVLNSRPYLAQKPQIWSIFYGNNFTWEDYVVWKLGTFGLKIGTFPRLLVVANYPCRIPCCIY